jgi:hypothetical protein
VGKPIKLIKFKSLLVLFFWFLGIPGMMVKAASDPEPESTITVPILLYHHVTKEKVSDRYNVTPSTSRSR